MNLISVENISKSYSEKVLLDNVSLGINEGEKIGIIGVNGTGKSTFLKIIAGFEEPESGNIIKGNKVRIEYLSQNPNYDENATIIEQVFKGNSQEMSLIREYEEILESVNNDSTNEDLHTKLMKIQTKIDDLNLWELESEAKTILTKLGVKDFKAKIKTLSGGQKKRVMLASALITPCELLILDEPTNHLDNETISWLESHLNSRKGALLMITHDRYFLDRVTNRILEIDKGRIFSYDGNYSSFLEKKIERIELEKATEDKRQNLIRKELAWVRRGAKARTTKQKARLDRFDDLVNQKGFVEDSNVEISVMGSRLGKKIIEIENINKAFGEKVLIKDFSYIVNREDRIGIIGDNGMGKSTLIKILEEKLMPDSGEVIKGETVKISCFSQDDEHMNTKMRAIDYMKEVGEYLQTSTGERITASQMCEKFLFDSILQWSPIEKLSGGERRRLHLLRILMESPNILLLDEPTNDLDIETLKRLEDFLDEFGGVVITVSHDRYFLDRICNKIFAYEGAGIISKHVGNYSDYLEIRKEKDSLKESENKTIKKEVIKKDEREKSKKLKFTYKEQKEFETIDIDIEELENKIQEIEESMNKNSRDFIKLQELEKEKDEITILLENKYERWEYLNDLNQKIEDQKTK